MSLFITNIQISSFNEKHENTNEKKNNVYNRYADIVGKNS